MPGEHSLVYRIPGLAALALLCALSVPRLVAGTRAPGGRDGGVPTALGGEAGPLGDHRNSERRARNRCSARCYAALAAAFPGL